MLTTDPEGKKFRWHFFEQYRKEKKPDLVVSRAPLCEKGVSYLELSPQERTLRFINALNGIVLATPTKRTTFEVRLL